MLNNIGKWKVTIFETGDFRLDGGAMMGSVPKVLWEKTNPTDKVNRIQMVLRCLLLDDGVNRILVDTGLGSNIKKDGERGIISYLSNLKIEDLSSDLILLLDALRSALKFSDNLKDPVLLHIINNTIEREHVK